MGMVRKNCRFRGGKRGWEAGRQTGGLSHQVKRSGISLPRRGPERDSPTFAHESANELWKKDPELEKGSGVAKKEINRLLSDLGRCWRILAKEGGTTQAGTGAEDGHLGKKKTSFIGRLQYFEKKKETLGGTSDTNEIKPSLIGSCQNGEWCRLRKSIIETRGKSCSAEVRRPKGCLSIQLT